jgi:hypothetical protein
MKKSESLALVLSVLVSVTFLAVTASAQDPEIQKNNAEFIRQGNGPIILIRRGIGRGVRLSLQENRLASIYVECFSYAKLSESCGCPNGLGWQNCIQSAISTSHTVNQDGNEAYVLNSGSPTWIHGLRFACEQEQLQQCQQQH